MAEPLSILYVSSRSDIGGGEIWLLRLLGTLDRARFNPCVLCPEGPLVSRVRELVVPVVPCPISHLRSPLSFFKTTWYFRNILRGFGVRLVHTCGLNVATSFLSRWFSVPEVIHMHTAGPLGRWIRWHLGRAERVVAVSEYAKRVLIQGGLSGQKIAVIQNGIDPHLFEKAEPFPFRTEWGFSPDTLLVGVVGQMIPGKGLETFLEAVSLLSQKRDLPIHFLIVGEAPRAEPEACVYKEMLQKRIREQGLERHVRLVGFVKDIPRLMRTLDILILCSELPEGSSLCCLEAMAASKPVIATRVGAVPEIVREGETGILIPPKDAAALSRAILRMAGEPALRQEMGKRGQKRVGPHFSLTDHVRRIEQLYEEILLPA